MIYLIASLCGIGLACWFFACIFWPVWELTAFLLTLGVGIMGMFFMLGKWLQEGGRINITPDMFLVSGGLIAAAIFASVQSFAIWGGLVVLFIWFKSYQAGTKEINEADKV